MKFFFVLDRFVNFSNKFVLISTSYVFENTVFEKKNRVAVGSITRKIFVWYKIKFCYKNICKTPNFDGFSKFFYVFEKKDRLPSYESRKK